MVLGKVTLQINLSPGDAAYAHLTVPALIEQHPEVDKVLLVVDTCKPGKTKLVDPAIRFPEPQFTDKVERVLQIAFSIQQQYAKTEVYVLKPNDPILATLSKKYLNNWYSHTHDYGGCANMAYWLGFELPETQYILHYDSDILLYQKKGYCWVEEAKRMMKNELSAVGACPRHSSPFPNADQSPSYQHGVPYVKKTGYWLDNFFSTRCLLLDKTRLQSFLPLVTGRILIETLAVKYLDRGFPRSPEIVMFRKIGGNKGKRLILDSFDSWLMHPLTKPKEYIENLPAIMRLVQSGIYPSDQLGDNIELDKWLTLIKQHEKA